MTNLALYYKKLTLKNNICSSMKKLIETLQSWITDYVYTVAITQ